MGRGKRHSDMPPFLRQQLRYLLRPDYTLPGKGKHYFRRPGIGIFRLSWTWDSQHFCFPFGTLDRTRLMKMKTLLRFMRDQDGGLLVEVAVMIPIMFTFLLGSIDFLNAYYQWNAATKAVEVGARLAAVSDPVADGLNTIPTQAVSSSVLLGDPMPDFEVTCDGATSGCTCTRGSCTGMGSYSATAMNTIVFGRGHTACNTTSTYYTIGMCNLLSGITDANVKIVYSQTGLGYAGRA